MNASLSTSKKFKEISLIVIVSVIAIIIYINLGILLYTHSRILPNVFINDINVGKLKFDDAKLKIDNNFKKQLDEFVIQLAYNDNTWNITRKDIDLYYLLDDSVENAYGVGREGSYINMVRTILNLKKNPKIVELELNYNLSKIENKINEISKEINKLPINAKIKRENKNFTITKEVLGIEIDKGLLKANIIDAINNFDSALININVKEIKPKITQENLNSIQDLIGESVTKFNSNDKGRTENIKIASNVINNIILMPGEEFSFNDSTGPRTAEAGYKKASVIVDGEFVTGIGGGICQVSTTLYNAALKADLEITSRRNHGLPVGYVPMGQDATVAYNYIDFKFKNNKKHPIYIESFIDRGQLYVRLYSKKTDNVYINLKSEILETIEPKMQVKKDENMYLSERKISKSGNKGYRVATYKIYLQDGRKIKKELVSKDYYPSRDGLIIEGIKEK